jgi:hypothetical protein
MAGLGGMKVTDMNGVKVYTVSGQKSFASWLAPDKKRSLRKDAGMCFSLPLLLFSRAISRRVPWFSYMKTCEEPYF